MGCVYFIRHGQTIWNVENKICGATDIALTLKGHEQAVKTGEKIKEMGITADEILYSPLIRAKDTALHISEITGIPAREEVRLKEQDFGRYEGTPRHGEEFEEAKKQFLNRYGDGESMMHLGQRVYNLLDEVTSSDKTYILVAHNGIARVVNSYFNEMNNAEYAAFGVDNCTVMKYEWDDKNKDICNTDIPENAFENNVTENNVTENNVTEIKKKTNAKNYNFWGCENASAKAVINDYKGIETPVDLYEALSHIWCRETCAPRMQNDWCTENMTLGQCSITAFLAQDIFGGKVYGIIRPGGNYHCYNVTQGCSFDLTSEQFLYKSGTDNIEDILDYSSNPEQFKEVHFAKEEKRLRYEYLKEQLKKYCS